MNFTVLEQSRFFIDLPESSQVMVLEATLSFIPDMALMKKACAKTLQCFPRFAGRAVIAADGKGVLMIRNTEEMPVSEEATPKELGTDETNNYLFRVIVSGRRLTFVAYHSLGDGLFFVRFFVQLLSHYMKEAGEDIAVEEPILSQGKDFQTLFEKPEEGFGDVMAEAPKLPSVGRDDLFFDPRDDALYGTRDFYTWRLLWDAGELKTVLSEYAVTPLVFFQVLISEILREQCAVGERVIEGGFAIDLHQRLHSVSQCEFGTLSVLHYHPEYDARSFEEKLLRTKKELDLRMELPAIRYELDKMNSYAADTLKYFDLRKPEVIREFLRKREKGGSTFFISNLGRLMMPPELLERMIGINIYSPPAGYEGNYYLYSLGDQSVLTYTGNSTSHQVMERLQEKLEKHGVHSRAEIIGLKQTDYLGRLPLSGYGEMQMEELKENENEAGKQS